MRDGSLDTDILDQFIDPVAPAAVVKPLVQLVSPETPAPPRRDSQYSSPFAPSATTASVVEVDDAMLGESVKIDFSTPAASSEAEEGHGSRLDPQHKTPCSSAKAEYSLCYLDKASNVCGAQIGVKVDAPFHLKPAGTCLVMAHKGRHPCCLGKHFFLKYTSSVGNEIALHPQSYIYILEDDTTDYDDAKFEYQRLDRMQVLYNWDEGLCECKKKEAAFKSFMEFYGSTDIVREETHKEAKAYAEGEGEQIRMEGIGNGEFTEEDGDEEDPVSQRVPAKLPHSFGKDTESDLSFGSLRKGSATNDLVMKLYKHVEGLVQDSINLAQQVQAQSVEIVGLEVMLWDAKRVI